MIKNLISKLVKTCPKCGSKHLKKRAKYCSRKCANSRDQSKRKKEQLPKKGEKICPRCGKKFTAKRNRYCSSKCAKTREWTDEKKRGQSLKIRIWKQTDEGEDNSYNIRKDKVALPTVPHPERRLKSGQFSDGEVLWNIVPGFEHPDDDWNN